MPRINKQTRIDELEKQNRWLQEQVTTIGEGLARSTVLVQTQDGEIGRLTLLNDKMFEIIHKLIARDS